MKNKNFTKFGLLIIMLISVLTGISNADISSVIKYQGKIQEDSLNLNSKINVQFRIYDAISDGTLLWESDTQEVTVNNGIFEAYIGETSSTSTPSEFTNITWGNGDKYLEVIVNGETLSPREIFTYVPYSIYSKKADYAKSTNVEIISNVRLSDWFNSSGKIKAEWLDIAYQGNQTGVDGSLVINLPSGLYTNNTATAVDSDLLAGNIKTGVNIFGIIGTYTSDATAVANDIRNGKTAYVNGLKLTGSLTFGSPLRTGQITGYRTGDDNTYRKGYTGGYTNADGSWNGSTRFTDNGDNTVTDNLTGLMWTKDANQGSGTVVWNTAIDSAESSTVAGYNDWRLPNVNELHSLIDYGNGSPALPTGHPFQNVQNSYYWSSTTYAPSTGNAWIVYLNDGSVNDSDKGVSLYAWFVRSGQ